MAKCNLSKIWQKKNRNERHTYRGSKSRAAKAAAPPFLQHLQATWTISLQSSLIKPGAVSQGSKLGPLPLGWDYRGSGIRGWGWDASWSSKLMHTLEMSGIPRSLFPFLGSFDRQTNRQTQINSAFQIILKHAKTRLKLLVALLISL